MKRTVVKSQRVPRQTLLEASPTLPVTPAASGAWEAALRRLVRASKRYVAPPAWWHHDVRYVGRVESLKAGASYCFDGMKRPGSAESPICCIHFTLAGWGNFALREESPQRIAPGMGFIAVVPSPHRYYLPEDSPGWTHGWLIIAHPYLVERFTSQVAATGPVLHLAPNSAFVEDALSLICSSYQKNLRDRFEVERALFNLLVDFDRLIHQRADRPGERDRLLEEVRDWVLANPQRPCSVDALAAEYGMSRSNFSHFFHSRTGLTPAKVVVQARLEEAARMLTETRDPVKVIAHGCGFANPNHFIRVFQRFKHVSPGAYRRSMA